MYDQFKLGIKKYCETNKHKKIEVHHSEGHGTSTVCILEEKGKESNEKVLKEKVVTRKNF